VNDRPPVCRATVSSVAVSGGTGVIEPSFCSSIPSCVPSAIA
jgi:hypothetical protein